MIQQILDYRWSETRRGRPWEQAVVLFMLAKNSIRRYRHLASDKQH